jgi:hypothetical protein
MRFRAILICLLFLTLTTHTKATNVYKPVHSGEVEITLNLVDRDKHEVAIFQQSHFVLEITEEESSLGCGELTFSTPVSRELIENGKTKVIADLNKLTFKEPGVYQFSIHGFFTTSKDLERDTVYYLTDNEYDYLTVYVSDNNGKLEISSYILGDDVKSFEYYGKLATNKLTIQKIVKGNQGSVFQKFDITVKVKNAIPNFTYNLKDGHTLTTDAKGYGRATIPLSHRDIITLTDLPIGSSYEVSEDYQDYQQSVSGKQSYLFRYPYQDIHVVFTNKKDGLIPTGIILNNGSTLLLIGSGIVILISAKKHSGEKKE